MTFSAVLRCPEGCEGTHPYDTLVHQCPACGGLLEVEHDLAALASRRADEWKRLFESRWQRGPWPFASGVWGKKEWIAPGIRNEHVVSLGEGGTPLLPVPRFAAEIGLGDLRVKQCGTSHTGSFKDLRWLRCFVLRSVCSVQLRTRASLLAVHDLALHRVEVLIQFLDAGEDGRDVGGPDDLEHFLNLRPRIHQQRFSASRGHDLLHAKDRSKARAADVLQLREIEHDDGRSGARDAVQLVVEQRDRLVVELPFERDRSRERAAFRHAYGERHATLPP
jgi:hypothetical protein